MAKITIGGDDYQVPELNFAALERSWPFVESAMVISSNDPMASPRAALCIIAAGIMEDENFQPQRYKITANPDDPDKIHEQIVNFLSKRMKAREMVNLKGCVDQILLEAGLTEAEPPSGEEGPVEETAILSPETAAGSSPS